MQSDKNKDNHCLHTSLINMIVIDNLTKKRYTSMLNSLKVFHIQNTMMLNIICKKK